MKQKTKTKQHKTKKQKQTNIVDNIKHTCNDEMKNNTKQALDVYILYNTYIFSLMQRLSEFGRIVL